MHVHVKTLCGTDHICHLPSLPADLHLAHDAQDWLFSPKMSQSNSTEVVSPTHVADIPNNCSNNTSICNSLTMF